MYHLTDKQPSIEFYFCIHGFLQIRIIVPSGIMNQFLFKEYSCPRYHFGDLEYFLRRLACTFKFTRSGLRFLIINFQGYQPRY